MTYDIMSNTTEIKQVHFDYSPFIENSNKFINTEEGIILIIFMAKK